MMDLKEDYMDVFSGLLLLISTWLIAIPLALLCRKWFHKEAWEWFGLKNEDMKAVLAGLSIIFAAAVMGTLFSAAMEAIGKNKLSPLVSVLFDFWFLGIVASLILIGAVISFAIFGLLKKIFKVE